MLLLLHRELRFSGGGGTCWGLDITPGWVKYELMLIIYLIFEFSNLKGFSGFAIARGQQCDHGTQRFGHDG